MAAIVPRGIPPRTIAFCHECGHPFHPRVENQRFCPETTCRRTYHGRLDRRARELYAVAYKRRKTRERGLFTIENQMLGDWIHEDKVRARKHKGIRDAYLKQQKESNR